MATCVKNIAKEVVSETISSRPENNDWRLALKGKRLTIGRIKTEYS